MRVARIQHGVVINVEGWEELPTSMTDSETLMDVDDVVCGPGWTYAEGVFSPPVPSVTDINATIDAELAVLDAKAIRSIRTLQLAMVDGDTATAATETTFLRENEAKAKALRATRRRPS